MSVSLPLSDMFWRSGQGPLEGSAQGVTASHLGTIPCYRVSNLRTHHWQQLLPGHVIEHRQILLTSSVTHPEHALITSCVTQHWQTLRTSSITRGC